MWTGCERRQHLYHAFDANPACYPRGSDDGTRRVPPTKRAAPSTLTAIGVVYGDIGTSPSTRFANVSSARIPWRRTHDNVLGVLSLILYALIIVVTIKYIAIVLRADNQGEGGILPSWHSFQKPGESRSRSACGGSSAPYRTGHLRCGAALRRRHDHTSHHRAGRDRGASGRSPLFTPYVLPISVTIILGIFVIQQFGTHRVGGLFGPVMVIWFVTIGALGIPWIVREPTILGALDPRHAVRYFIDNGWHGFPVLGAVVLAVTGGEALYADMGHFGKRPIRVAWCGLVLPTLMLNYFGQGAMILLDPAAAKQPFFLMTPEWFLYPLVVIATLAAIIASQALISGAFSLTRQAVLLGYAPRLDIAHTSPDAMGQIYVPQVNWALRNRHPRHRHRIQVVERPRVGVWRCRHHDDGHHRALAPCAGHRTVEVACLDCLVRHDGVSHGRPGIPRCESHQGHPGGLAANRHRPRRVHAHDDVEDRTAYCWRRG